MTHAFSRPRDEARRPKLTSYEVRPLTQQSAAQPRFDRALFAEMLDSMDEAYIAFDARGGLVSRNIAFGEIPGDHRELEHEGRRLALSHSREAGIDGRREFATRCGGYRLRITHAGPPSDATRLVLVAYEKIAAVQPVPLSVHHRLTPRELQVAELVAEGRTNHDVASVLGVSQHTVRHHVARLLAKLGLERRGEIAARFWRFRTHA